MNETYATPAAIQRAKAAGLIPGLVVGELVNPHQQARSVGGAIAQQCCASPLLPGCDLLRVAESAELVAGLLDDAGNPGGHCGNTRVCAQCR